MPNAFFRVAAASVKLEGSNSIFSRLSDEIADLFLIHDSGMTISTTSLIVSQQAPAHITFDFDLINSHRIFAEWFKMG